MESFLYYYGDFAIKKNSGTSLTGYKLTAIQSNNHENNGIIGKNYKN